MAKSFSIIKLQGTLDGMTHVQSKTYGEHIRKARRAGEVNETLKDNNRQIVAANAPARLIKNAIDQYREDFKGGQLWQRLVSHFKKELKEKQFIDVLALKDKEVNEHYPLSRIYSEVVSITIDPDKRILKVIISRGCVPNFKRKYIDGYKLSAIAVFPDFEGYNADSLLQETAIIAIAGSKENVCFEFDLKSSWRQYLICLKLEGCSEGNVCAGDSVRGMRIVATGKIDPKV